MEDRSNNSKVNLPIIPQASISTPTVAIITHATGNETDLSSKLGELLPEATQYEIYQVPGNETISGNTIIDKDGAIPQEVADKIIIGGKNVSIAIVGGNLRGCLSTTFSSITSAIRRNKPLQVDVAGLL